jgi:hypothetical protein
LRLGVRFLTGGSDVGYVLSAGRGDVKYQPISLRPNNERLLGPAARSSSPPAVRTRSNPRGLNKEATIRLTAPAYWKFESISLQQRVCELPVPERRTDRRERPIKLGGRAFDSLLAPIEARGAVIAGHRRCSAEVNPSA